jgi:hypothetical protein
MTTVMFGSVCAVSTGTINGFLEADLLTETGHVENPMLEETFAAILALDQETEDIGMLITVTQIVLTFVSSRAVIATTEHNKPPKQGACSSVFK